MAKSDEKALELINIVKEKRLKISKIEKSVTKTNSSFSFVEDSLTNAVNLKTVSDISLLVKMYSFISMQEDAFRKACSELQIDTEFTWRGFSGSDWKEDIKNRIEKISIIKEKEELDKLENKLNSLVSKEKRAELELEAIASLLTK